MKHFIIPVAAGADPQVAEAEDGELFFPEIDTPCENPDAPGGQCYFNAVSMEPDRCLYCGKRTG